MKPGWMVVTGAVLFAFNVCAEEPQPLKTRTEKASYGVGVQMGRNLKRQGTEFDLDLVIKGMKDGLLGEKLLITEQDLRKILIEVQAEMRAKSRQQRSSQPASKPGNPGTPE